jgi:protein-disulfide isomerase
LERSLNNSPRFYYTLIPLAFILGLAAGYLTWGRPFNSAASTSAANLPAETQESAQPESPQAAPSQDSSGQDAAQQAAAQQAAGQEDAGQNQQVIRYDVPIDDDPVLGPDDAPITLIEFSDYECPYCRRWHLEVFPRLLENYSDKIRFVYRDFPLTSIHPNAVPAAEAANCAHEQDMFWEFNEALFSMRLGLNQDAYLAYAEELELDLEAFSECVSSGRHQAEVLADLQWASNLGVRSTPTFFLNGIALVGAQPYELFQEVIEKELAGEIP